MGEWLVPSSWFPWPWLVVWLASLLAWVPSFLRLNEFEVPWMKAIKERMEVKCRRGLLCSPWWLTWHDTWHDVALSYLDVVYKVLASVKLHRGFRLATYARIVIQPLMPISARQNWNLAAKYYIRRRLAQR